MVCNCKQFRCLLGLCLLSWLFFCIDEFSMSLKPDNCQIFQFRNYDFMDFAAVYGQLKFNVSEDDLPVFDIHGKWIMITSITIKSPLFSAVVYGP